MYSIRRSVDIHFAHHIRGHRGSCINIHGHTWKFEVVVGAKELDAEGFVVDFRQLKQEVLEPCYQLLDHSLALGAETYSETKAGLIDVGQAMLASREAVHGMSKPLETPNSQPGDAGPSESGGELGGAFVAHPGGMKVTVFPFSPTSERLAKWLFDLASHRLNDERVKVQIGRVYESLHPVESVAEWLC